MSIGTLPPSLPSRHASLPSPFSLLPTPISPRVETSHHVVTSARDSAPVVAPSPVTTPDAMMSLTAIEHLDFEPSCDVPGCERPAGIVVEVLPHLTHIAKSARAGRRHTPCLPCWRRIIAPQAALCGCGMVVGWRDLWKIVEGLR